MTHPDRAALMREAAIELCESAQHDDPPLSPLDCAMAIRRLPLPPPTDDAQPEPVSVVDVYPDAATRERRRAEMQNAEASVAPVSADDARKLAMAVEALQAARNQLGYVEFDPATQAKIEQAIATI